MIEFEQFNLRHLRYFLAVCESGSFRAAAARVNVAQSALSRRILDLERAFDVDLLVRHARGVTISPDGAALRQHAQRICDEIDAALADARAADRTDHGPVRIGFFGTTSQLSIVPELIARIRSGLPHVQLELRPGLAGDVDAAALTGLDIAFHVASDDDPTGYECQLLYEADHLVAIGSAASSALPQWISFDKLAREDLILAPRAVNAPLYDALLAQAASTGRSLNIMHETPSERTRLAFASAEVGLTIVSPLAPFHDPGFDVHYLDLADLRLPFRLCVSRPLRGPAPAVSMIIDLATEYMAALGRVRSPLP